MADGNSRIVPIVVAIIGVLGVICAALIAKIPLSQPAPNPSPISVPTQVYVPERTTPAEPLKLKASEPRSAIDIIGLWNVENFTSAEARVQMRLINGGDMEMFLNGQRTGDGIWSYVAETLTMRNSESTIRSTVKWLSENTFVATIVATTDDALKIGQKLQFNRVR
jgi:hypothetical protein